MTSLIEFKYFPKLPLEIRLRIWRDSFPPPSTIELRMYYLSGVCVNTGSSPVTLRINHESRVETLRHFVVYDLSMLPSRLQLKHRRRIIFKFDDTLEFLAESFIWMDNRLLNFLRDLNSKLLGGLGRFKHLRLHFVPSVALWNRDEERAVLTELAQILSGLTLITLQLRHYPGWLITDCKDVLNEIFNQSGDLRIVVEDMGDLSMHSNELRDLIDFMEVRDRWVGQGE